MGFEKVIELLKDSIELDNDLQYIEPWGWMHPARQIIGALCLEQNKFLELACDSYLEDMGMAKLNNAKCPNPGNIWSVRGLLELEGKCGSDPGIMEKVDFEEIGKLLSDLEKNC